MELILLAFSLLSLFSPPIDHGSVSCFADTMMTLNLSGVNTSDPEVQQNSRDLCETYHDLTGHWLSTDDLTK